MLKGNPIVENVLYYKGADLLPQSGTDWQTLGPWIERGQFDNGEFLNPDGIDININWTTLKYFMIAVPLANINGDASGARGSEKIKLREVYSKDAPAYTYDFGYIDVPFDPASVIVDNSGYRIYYVPGGKLVGPTTITLEFTTA